MHRRIFLKNYLRIISQSTLRSYRSFFFLENVRERAITLISKAYSSLGLTVFASMTGLTLEEARRVVLERGWSMDGTMVQPCKIEKEEECNVTTEIDLTEDQLRKLTQFVSFLEN